MSNKIHNNVRLQPLCRLVWTQASARDYWKPELDNIRALVNKARIEAFKQGITKTYGFWMHVDNQTPVMFEHLEQHGKLILDLRAGSSPHREHKHYMYFNRSTGNYYLYANQDNVPMFQEDMFRNFDLNLTLGYCEADSENMFWYYELARQGIYDPIGEMENKDKMNPYLNPFFRHLGVSLIPYVAKSWDDEYSLNLAHKMFEIMKSIDEETANKLMQLLELPVRWDCWRGIAIVDTLIFKTITDSTPYREQVIVDYELPKMANLLNRAKVPGATKGTAFPYITKAAELMQASESHVTE